MRFMIKALVVAIATLFPMAHASSSFGAEYELTFATHAIPNSFRGEAEKLFLDEVTAQTKGAVEFKIFWGESLLKGSEILKGVGDGIVDSGLVNVAYSPKQLIVNNAVNLMPGGSSSYEAMVEFHTRCINEIPDFKNEFIELQVVQELELYMKFAKKLDMRINLHSTKIVL